MILVDTSVLVYLLNPNAAPPKDNATGKVVDHCQLRIEHFIDTHKRAKIIIATPSLAELLVKAGDSMGEFLGRIEKSSTLRLMPFDKAAALECALLEQYARRDGDKKGGSEAVWAKVKVDRQILAVGRVAGAVDFYSDDIDLRKMATRLQISVKGIADMPLPLGAAQQLLSLDV